jgi:hypothetical protein
MPVLNLNFLSAELSHNFFCTILGLTLYRVP